MPSRTSSRTLLLVRVALAIAVLSFGLGADKILAQRQLESLHLHHSCWSPKPRKSGRDGEPRAIELAHECRR